MTNDEGQTITYGVKLGTLKRKKSAVWRFIWEFLLVAAITLGTVFYFAARLPYHLKHQQDVYDEISPVKTTIYDSQARAIPHGEIE
jgi:hypothetical protein